MKSLVARPEGGGLSMIATEGGGSSTPATDGGAQIISSLDSVDIKGYEMSAGVSDAAVWWACVG